MHFKINKHVKLFLSIGSILLFGTLGYYYIEGTWTLFESFYMTVISITTVGYGETKPLTDAGRAFTIVLIFIGIGTAVNFAGHLAKTILENNLKYGAKKMMKRIDKLRDHYIICGYGDIGSSICSSLNDSKIPFVVIDHDEKSLEYARRRNYLVIEGQAVYDTTLLEAGIKKAKGIVICLGDDSINMNVSLAAREINPDIFIIARGYKSFIEKRMMRAGANSVVNPLKLGGKQIAELISKQYSSEENHDSLQTQSSLMGFSLRIYQHFLINKVAVKEIKERLGAISVLKLKRENGEEIENPSETLKLSKNETLLLLVNEEALEKKVKRFITFEWSSEFSLGFKLIDNDHKKLFELVNNFVYQLNKGQGKNSLVKTFDELLDYTVIHFGNEERIFKKYNYPGLEEHQKEHRELVDKLVKLNKDKQYIFAENVADFLTSWLVDHILGSDMQYVNYFREKKINIDL